MAKFKKKPVVIDAEQWFPGKNIAGVTCLLAGVNYPGPEKRGDILDAWVETLEGKMAVTAGDWIITGVKGEKYPCKPDIFAMTYDPCPDEELAQTL